MPQSSPSAEVDGCELCGEAVPHATHVESLVCYSLGRKRPALVSRVLVFLMLVQSDVSVWSVVAAAVVRSSLLWSGVGVRKTERRRKEEQKLVAGVLKPGPPLQV